MCKCRRLIAAVTAYCLSLACIASFSFSASADNPLPLVSLYWQFADANTNVDSFDVGNWYSAENSFVSLYPHKYWSLTKVRVVHRGEPCDFWASFNLNFLSTTDDDSRTISSAAGSIDGTKNGSWTSGEGSVYLQPRTSFPNEITMLPNMFPISGGRRVLIHFKIDDPGSDQFSDFTFTSRGVFASSGSNKPNIIPVCSDFQIATDLYSLIYGGFDNVQNKLLDIVNYCDWLYTAISSFHSRMQNALFSTYDWKQLSYDDETGDIITETRSGNYFDALLGSIQSLNADAQAQAAQQEKANEVGAGDALDTAFDSVGSSFGSLGDLSGLGELGGFNGDAMGSAGSAGLLDWFSQRTADSIDAVSKKKQPLDIVDFYSSKIEDYEEVMNDGSTDP